MTGELSGRAAIVTGGTRGIGQAIAAALAGAGADVLLTGRQPDAAREAARALRDETGGRIVGLSADQGSDADWARVMAGVKDAFGRLDALVVNAGVSEMAATVEMTLDAFRSLHRVNLKGAFLAVKHAAALFRDQGGGGSIALVGSIAGRIGVKDHLHYTSSKAGVRMLAKAAALELGPQGVRVNLIQPGFTDTGMAAEFTERVTPLIPLRRFGQPREVADAALFLCSDRSRFMTGAEIVIDGGWTVQ